MTSHALTSTSERLRYLIGQRALPTGGFPANPGGKYQPDATAWAIIALTTAGVDVDTLRPSRMMLKKKQLEDGRICLQADNPSAHWPTPLAVLAWNGDDEFKRYQNMAVQFLLHAKGRHWPKPSDSVSGHDPSIPGWPWVSETHSWVEPTSMALIALRASNAGKTRRAQEAERLLLDRQLRTGGWNYGNTTVFGQELRPMPETTGVALTALTGRLPKNKVARSITYLADQVKELNTPLSVGWSLLGLSAWGEELESEQTKTQINNCLKLQNKYGPYETSLLSILLLASLQDVGLSGLLA